ncbi:hypothetical protein SDC9_97632 [bioreactor metagenome]|uniref:Uncharacterized protein n=1 Tax=bioreactor metagenome TaxID=1076179 RepID=A0A645AD55_9ZZZZ
MRIPNPERFLSKNREKAHKKLKMSFVYCFEHNFLLCLQGITDFVKTGCN